jgi:hypothetical protein
MSEVPHRTLVASTPWENTDRLSRYCLYGNESGKQNLRMTQSSITNSDVRKLHQQCLFLLIEWTRFLISCNERILVIKRNYKNERTHLSVYTTLTLLQYRLKNFHLSKYIFSKLITVMLSIPD